MGEARWGRVLKGRTWREVPMMMSIGGGQVLRVQVAEPLPETLAKKDDVRLHQAPTRVALGRHVPQDVRAHPLGVMGPLAVD